MGWIGLICPSFFLISRTQKVVGLCEAWNLRGEAYSTWTMSAYALHFRPFLGSAGVFIFIGFGVDLTLEWVGHWLMWIVEGCVALHREHVRITSAVGAFA